MAGLDGDATACQLIKDGYVDATGVQDLYFEAEPVADRRSSPPSTPARPSRTRSSRTRASPSPPTTSATREMDMWGCVLLSQGFLKNKS